MKKRKLFGVAYSICDTDGAVKAVLSQAPELRGKYVCFSNVHTLVMAVDNDRFRHILNQSAYTFPDGAPVARRLRKIGEKTAQRVAGPDFMEAVFGATSDGKLSHFFFGTKVSVLEKLTAGLKKRYPHINIAGTYAPPYRKLTVEEDKQITDLINESGADVVWVGLGAPKQEKFMSVHRDRINALMIGVGAGFDYQAGTKKRAPQWMQRASLEWFHRLLSEPARLAPRYFVTNTKFIWYCLTKQNRL